jgi:hypothetical protein
VDDVPGGGDARERSQQEQNRREQEQNRRELQAMARGDWIWLDCARRGSI